MNRHNSLRIQFDDNDTQAFFQRGLAYLKTGNREPAFTDFKMAAIQGHPKAYPEMKRIH